jgi:hypothetical protein
LTIRRTLLQADDACPAATENLLCSQNVVYAFGWPLVAGDPTAVCPSFNPGFHAQKDLPPALMTPLSSPVANNHDSTCFMRFIGSLSKIERFRPTRHTLLTRVPQHASQLPPRSPCRSCWTTSLRKIHHIEVDAALDRLALPRSVQARAIVVDSQRTARAF